MVNRIGDRECTYQPPRAVVASVYMQHYYPAARIIPAGIDVNAIRYRGDDPGAYLAMLAQNVAHKGLAVAQQVAERTHLALMAHGDGHEAGPVTGEDRWRHLGGAWALLYPSTRDAAPRAPLEAAACGTPTICLDGDGTQEHAEHGVSGFVCADADEMVEAVGDVRYLDRAQIRAWVADAHPLARMVGAYEAALQAAADGEVW